MMQENCKSTFEKKKIDLFYQMNIVIVFMHPLSLNVPSRIHFRYTYCQCHGMLTVIGVNSSICLMKIYSGLYVSGQRKQIKLPLFI